MNLPRFVTHSDER